MLTIHLLLLGVMTNTRLQDAPAPGAANSQLPPSVSGQAPEPIPVPVPVSTKATPSGPGTTSLTVTLKEEPKPPEPPSKFELLDAPGLLKYGIGVGVAAVFISKIGNHGKVTQTDLGTSAMPYLAIFPGYWGLGGVTREYCAARRLLISKDESQARADKLAKYMAHTKYERLSQKEKDADKKAWEALHANEGNLEARKKLIENEKVIKYVGWDPAYAGKCYLPWTMLGIYGGLPLGYSASFDVDGPDMAGPKKTLDVKTRGSFGLAIAPIAYVNLLIGVTRVSTQVPDMAFDSSWRLTFAVGGTLDIFAKLFK